MDLGVNGLNAIILGGSRGIGRYTANLLASEGCNVAICARGEDGVNQAAEEIEDLGTGKVFAQAADLEQGDQVKAFTAAAIDAHGGVDILIHNASGFDLTGDEPGWRRSFEVDMMAGVRSVEVALDALKASDHASITFVGSQASSQFFGRRSSYGPAKAAMRAYANELAQDLGKYRIRANVVSPGAIVFPGGSWAKRKKEMPDFYKSVEKQIPLGRLGTGEEMARIIAFVASPAGLWINSTHIAGDGGQVAAVD